MDVSGLVCEWNITVEPERAERSKAYHRVQLTQSGLQPEFLQVCEWNISMEPDRAERSKAYHRVQLTQSGLQPEFLQEWSGSLCQDGTLWCVKIEGVKCGELGSGLSSWPSY